MPKFLTTRKVASTLEDIITEANEKLVLFSPYVFIPFNLIDRIKHAVERKVKVTLVTRGYDMKEPEIKKWEAIGFNVLIKHDLHAKAYYNEKEAIITSFNLIDSSEKFNIEFGMSVNIGDDEALYKKIIFECEMVIRTSTPLKIKNGRSQISEKIVADKIQANTGYCISCGDKKEKNIHYPYCYECWVKFTDTSNDPTNKEKYCHFCKRNHPASLKHPLCGDCTKLVLATLNP